MELTRQGIGYMAVLALLIGIVGVTLTFERQQPTEPESDVCWLELYNTDVSVKGFKVPAYDLPYYYDRFGQGSAVTKTDCDILREKCSTPTYQDALGCIWLDGENVCECDFSRAVVTLSGNIMSYT